MNFFRKFKFEIIGLILGASSSYISGPYFSPSSTQVITFSEVFIAILFCGLAGLVIVNIFHMIFDLLLNKRYYVLIGGVIGLAIGFVIFVLGSYSPHGTGAFPLIPFIVGVTFFYICVGISYLTENSK